MEGKNESEGYEYWCFWQGYNQGREKGKEKGG